ncbi:MAG: HAD-IA family hydrolase [Actinobacteria bacterium]|nr:HAD-IA family hydrolase [Actinomycetota bacterium]
MSSDNDLAAVVFDVDGTLVESERHGHRVAFNSAFDELDMPDRWDEETYGRLLEVSGGERRLRHYLEEQGHADDHAAELASQLHEIKTRRFRELADGGEIPERPGATRLLDELADAGIPVAVATTGTRAWVEPLLDKLFGLERFAVIRTGTEVEDRKPDPKVFVETVSALDVPPERSVAVEDSENGVVAARAAGLPCVVIVNDYTREQDFEGAALVVDRFGAPGRCEVLAGPQDLLEDGAVTLRTLRAVAASHGNR